MYNRDAKQNWKLYPACYNLLDPKKIHIWQLFIRDHQNFYFCGFTTKILSQKMMPPTNLHHYMDADPNEPEVVIGTLGRVNVYFAEFSSIERLLTM